MHKSHRIIDADTHVYEPAELLEKNLDAEYAKTPLSGGCCEGGGHL